MLRLFVIYLFAFSFLGCSASKSTFVYSDPLVTNQAAGSDSTEAKKAIVDDGKPATFGEYRQWRKSNDPGGQTYAEYKEWEAAYKQWLKDQAKAASQ